ncbi:MAG: YceH family protein [Acidobacteria bacterium]|nr:YceH family protein [Acidobacteriota bacterium]
MPLKHRPEGRCSHPGAPTEARAGDPTPVIPPRCSHPARGRRSRAVAGRVLFVAGGAPRLEGYDRVVPAFELTPTEARVLGALLEKDITTPDYYPLSLNALVNACNQKSNREPVMDLSEDQVRDALHSLQEKRLAGPSGGADSRVTKYGHRLQEALNLDRRQTALVCVLLLRGAQTPGELRGRSERLYRFETIDDVISTLQRLSQHEPPLAHALARQPGTKEARYIHLMSPADAAAYEPPPPSAPSVDQDDRFARLEETVAELRRTVADLQERFDRFQRQFE